MYVQVYRRLFLWNYVVPCVMLDSPRQALVGNIVLGVANAVVLAAVVWYFWW